MKKCTLIVFLSCVSMIVSARAQETLYVATGSKGAAGVLYTVNPLTAAFTMVGPITIGTSVIGMTGLAFDPLNGVLYGVTGFESPTSKRSLVTINPATGAAALIGSLNDAFGLTGITDISFRSDGTLFGTSSSELYTINLGTGALTAIGATGNTNPGGGLAFNSLGTLYTASLASGSLDTLNPATGARTVGPTMTNAPFGAPLGAMNALAFNSSDTLYASDSDRAQNGATTVQVDLVTINTTTGVVTNIGSLPNDIDAIAFGPAVPEPSVLALLGMGAVAAGFWRRRKNR